MGRPKPARSSNHFRIRLGNRLVEYKVVRSKSARALRIRVGPGGVDVVQPSTRKHEELTAFLTNHSEWILDQLNRAARLRGIRRPSAQTHGEIPYRGKATQVRLETSISRSTANKVRLTADGVIFVSRGPRSRTPPARSLERWLRRNARREIASHLSVVTARLGRSPQRVYVMGQRTKWGNCSPRQNLSFNWRLILAPDYDLRYLVTHEAVHLAIPDHSQKFWLTVRSLCKETEVARQWLCRNHAKIDASLESVF